MKKVFFRCNSPCFTNLLLFSLEKKNSKVLNGDVYGTYLWDVPGTKRWDVLGTSTGRRSDMFLKFNSETYKTYFDKLLKTL